MKQYLLIALLFLGVSAEAKTPKPILDSNNPKIQIALLLDVSNSMDGLIDQAKAQLWKIVNELADMQQNGQYAQLEIALYTFGDDRLLEQDGYIQRWTTFTNELDLISKHLFALTTSGGDEYCGWTIQEAVESLDWSGKYTDLQMIVIAGNESFAQGAINYIRACEKAVQKHVIINTIYCGHCPDGTRLFWEDAADRAQGKYMCIDQNEEVIHIPTPYDSLIQVKNKALNATYLGYGQSGRSKKAMQMAMDEEAEAYDNAYMAERAVSKASRAYANASWDLLDAYKDDPEKILQLKQDELPEELKGLNRKEQKAFIEKLQADRNYIQTEISELALKRKKFIEEYKQKAHPSSKGLEAAMLGIIRQQAEEKGFIK